MEEQIKDKIPKEKPKFSLRKYSRSICILFIALTAGIFHYSYVDQLHENDTNFSYLSDLEREMMLRTEMGFYYSYYKTVVEQKPFLAAISRIMYDKHVEYPTEVNAFNRFNIIPEVVIGSVYRYLEPWINTTTHIECHLIDRGEGLSPVQSCVGIGEPMVFYLKVIFGFAGLNLAAVFLSAVALSETITGGILAALQYVGNHSEATRVMWAPNERENFAAPLLVLQGCLLTAHLRDPRKRNSFYVQVTIFWLNCLCLLFWQFTQFIFLSQVIIFFFMEQLRIIELKTLGIFLHTHFCGLHMAIFLLQGNDMLKTSQFTSVFIVVSLYCLIFSSFRIKVEKKLDLIAELWLIILRTALVGVFSVYLKLLICDIFEVQDDSHIWELLYAKFTDYKTFHTLIYTSGEVFGFLPLTTVVGLCKSLLLPIVLLTIVKVCNYHHKSGIRCVKNYLKKKKKHYQISESGLNNSTEDDDDSGIENNTDTFQNNGGTDIDYLEKQITPPNYRKDSFIVYLEGLNLDSAFVFHLGQLCVFAIMATMVMRLKLLFVPQLCIMSSMFLNRKYKYNSPLRRTYWWAAYVAVIAHTVYTNMTEELALLGEYTNVEQEELLQWISNETSAGAAFAGSMPILASVMLSTRRPIVAHPHYENKNARDRVYAVYKVYGRFTAEELYQELTKLKVAYLIVERNYCYGRGNNGKSLTFPEIWDVEAPHLSRRRPLCDTLLSRESGGVSHLYRVFSNSQYAVFRVHDMSVRYMPRSFDT